MNEQNIGSSQNQSMPPESRPALNEGSKNTLLAAHSYFGILVIIPILAAKGSSFVKFHVRQGLVLLVLWIIIWIFGMIFGQLTTLWSILNIILTILALIGIVNVIQGKEKNLPLVGQFSKFFRL